MKQKWNQELREKKFGPLDDKILSNEEKMMSKAQLKRKWVKESQQRWLERQKELGIVVEQCEICRRWKRRNDNNHWCYRSGVRMQGVGGLGCQELVVKKTDG